jgi:hypothetical protein
VNHVGESFVGLGFAVGDLVKFKRNCSTEFLFCDGREHYEMMVNEIKKTGRQVLCLLSDGDWYNASYLEIAK